jgi:tetratricopeptide (TPR) repeat protein
MSPARLIPFAFVFVLLSALAPARVAWAQKAPTKGEKKPVACSVKLLTDANIGPLTIDAEALGRWMRPIIQAVETQYHEEKAAREVVIQIVLRRKGEHEMSTAGRPALSEAEIKDLRGLVDLAKVPRPMRGDFAFQFVAQVNGGDPDRSHELAPKLADPFQSRLETFARGTTAEQVAALRDWAREEAIPVLAALAAKSDQKFPGVILFGRTLSGLDYSKPLDVEALTYRNPDFWRATLEMNPGQPLTPTALIALYCSNGELDKARRVGEIAAFFDAKEPGPGRLLTEFRLLHRVFNARLNARVKQGIALNDKGQFDPATEIYKSVLRDYPNSAWANYEIFQTARMKRMAAGQPLEGEPSWLVIRARILACDPLYESMAEAKGPDETYQLLRRMQINTLFQTAAKAPADLLEYADIARDLDHDGFAALIDWYAFVRFSTKARGGRDVLEEFLYSLDRLGIKDIQPNFAGDHPAGFARIDAQRKKAREESVARKMMKDDKVSPAKSGP